MEKKKRNQVLSLVAILVVLLLVVGATYAYFQAQSDGSRSTDVNVTTATTDNLTFTTGDAISINATQSNFASGAGNLSDSTTASATLVANNATNSATANYYVYLNIDTNEFEYTSSDAELILTVTIDGVEVTELDGLTYTTVTDGNGESVSGFDITTASGLITIANNYEISTTSSTTGTTQEWEITVTFVNLDGDQTDNAGKSFSAELRIRKDEDKSSYNLANVCSSGDNLADCIQTLYTEDGADNLYYFDGSGSYINASYEADDLSYRYSGASDSTNNFVCFGSTDETCGNDNLYRIIGIFQNDSGSYEIKLIKYDYATSDLLGTNTSDYGGTYSSGSSYYLGSNYSNIARYSWNYTNYGKQTYSNDWSISELNKTHLNTNYLTNIGSTWSNLIATHTWIVGGNTYANIYSVTANETYANEITSPVTSQVTSTYSNKIGLIYVSDYAYATAPTYWTITTSNYNSEVYAYNWMFMGLYEWTITRNSYYGYGVFYIHPTGGVSECDMGDVMAIRPTFYLDSSVQYSSGSGTQSDPIRLVVD